MRRPEALGGFICVQCETAERVMFSRVYWFWGQRTTDTNAVEISRDSYNDMEEGTNIDET